MKGYAFFFDSKSTANILKGRRRLEKHTKLYQPFEKKIDPHITINYAEEMNFEETDKQIRHYIKTTLPFELKFYSVGIFPNNEKNELFLNPQPSMILFNSYRLIRNLTIEGKAVNEGYFFDTWVPHCTITTNFEEKNYTKFITEIQSVLKLSINNPLRVKVSKCVKYIADIENRKIKLIEL